jgi:hypothetical protein
MVRDTRLDKSGQSGTSADRTRSPPESDPANNQFLRLWVHVHNRNYPHLRIMCSSPRRYLTNTVWNLIFGVDELRIIFD